MDKVAEVLQALATQLGTTVEKLWPYLVRQQVIEGWCALITLIVLGVLIPFALRFSRKRADWSDDENGINVYAGFQIACTIFWVGWGFCLVFGMSEILSKIMNPEYWALQDLMKMIR